MASADFEGSLIQNNSPSVNNGFSSPSFKGWRDSTTERKKQHADVFKLKNLLLQKQRILNSCNAELLPDGGKRLIDQIKELELEIEKEQPHTVQQDSTEPSRSSTSKNKPSNQEFKKPVIWAGPPPIDDQTTKHSSDQSNTLPSKPVIWAGPPPENLTIEASCSDCQYNQNGDCQQNAEVKKTQSDLIPKITRRENDLVFAASNPKTYSKVKTYEFANKTGVKLNRVVLTEPHHFQNNNGANHQTYYGGRMTKTRIEKVQSVTEAAVIKLHNSLDNCPGPGVLALDPPQLSSCLLPHQRQALAWMLWREGQDPSGGVLADDMGLGKTLTFISLLLQQELNKEHDTRKESLARKDLVKSEGTLVVCPASLLLQWEKEVDNHCKPGSLNVYLYHGPNREKDIHKLASYSMVITTYSILTKEIGDYEEKKGDDNMCQAPVPLCIVWERVVIDEAHTIKNPKSKCCNAVCQLRAIHRWALTGTPINNDLQDMYALLRFLRVSPFDELKVWKKWVDNKTSQGKERLSTLIKSLLLRRTKDQLDSSGKPLVSLPTKSFKVHRISLSEKEREIYNQFDKQIRSTLSNMLKSKASSEKGGRSKSQVLIFTLLLRLQQTCNHLNLLLQTLKESEDEDDLTRQMKSLTVQDSRSKSQSPEVIKDPGKEDIVTANSVEEPKAKVLSPEEEITGKLNALKVEEENVTPVCDDEKLNLAVYKNDKDFESSTASTKVRKLLKKLKKLSKLKDKSVVVSQWTSMLSIVAEHLKRNQIAFAVIQGNVSVKNRMSSVNDFNDPRNETQVMLVSIKAGGVGLNLIGGNHLFLLDVHWNPALESQACDRVFRFGQTKPVTIHRFICKDTVEEKILELQSRKLELARSVLSGGDKAHVRLTLEDLKQLFCLKPDSDAFQ